MNPLSRISIISLLNHFSYSRNYSQVVELYNQIKNLADLEMGIDFWNKVYMDFFKPDEAAYIQFMDDAVADHEYPKKKVMKWVEEKMIDASYEYFEANKNY
jgi:hypothetical protein